MGILVVVFLAEYVAVDHTDTRYPLATAILTSLAFVIFLILVSMSAIGSVILIE